ncbi:hypothetical protein DDQ50_12960 [Amnibacterium flavum]|uniref:Uncharacterized protein n=1 Tax=Amnibacterium flavum TaxID=2173173 RepID=A0A2V1HUG4_9MICO|nr:hypothetical protein DDQ50_12960 [Amnibacterium flavum]
MLTADTTASALLSYAQALAVCGGSDLVTIPVVTESGARADAQFLIGPASQILSLPVENSWPEPEDADLVADLSRRAGLRAPGADTLAASPMLDDAASSEPCMDYI